MLGEGLRRGGEETRGGEVRGGGLKRGDKEWEYFHTVFDPSFFAPSHPSSRVKPHLLCLFKKILKN